MKTIGYDIRLLERLEAHFIPCRYMPIFKMMTGYVVAFIFVLSFPSPMKAQEVTTQLAFGGVNNLDTYLSPEKYRGFEGRFISEVLRYGKKPTLAYSLTHEGSIATTHNRANTANELSGGYSFAYSMMYRTAFLDGRLHVLIGGMVHYGVGFTYNTRNAGNNPAQGYMSLDFGPNVMLHYELSLWNKNIGINWEARMPLAGLMFSPNYGQSYYEIFNRGNYDHNIVFTSVAVPQLRHHFTVDVPLSEVCSLRVGYLGDYSQAKPNNIKQHGYYNAGTVGVVIRKK